MARSMIVPGRRHFLLFALACLLAAMPVYLVIITPSSAQASALLSINGSNSINWGSLMGVNYGWSALGASCAGNAPNPSTSFPQMKANGWNLVRVPIGWDLAESNPSNFVSYMQTISSQADTNGLYVIYDFHTINDCGWPSGVASQYPTTSALYSAWWADQVTYNGQNGWQAQFNDFWKPIISAVDSHSSTLGYEIMNEPPGTGSQEQPYNQFLYNSIRALTSKVILYGAPFNCPGCGVTFGTAPAQAAKPNGINIAMDVHDYDDTSGVLTHIQQWQQVNGLVGIVMGEFGARSAGSQSVAQSYLQTYYSAFKQTGIASTYWWWECGASLSGTGRNFLVLLDNNCQQWWIDTAIVQTQNQIYGGGSTTTASTTSTRSQISSTSTSTTSSMSSLTTTYSSASSSHSSTISSSEQTSTASVSRIDTQSTTDSATRLITASQSDGNKALAPSSSPSLTKGAVITYSFAGYEIALIGGLPLVARTARKSVRNGRERNNSSGWRW